MSVSLETFIAIYIKTISVVRLKTPGIPSLGVLFFLPIPHSQFPPIRNIIPKIDEIALLIALCYGK